MKKMLSSLLCAALIISLLPALPALAAESGPFALGSTDLEIQNGGIMLTAGDTLYFSLEGGIFAETGDAVRAVCAGNASNLNLWQGCIYFTDGSTVYRVAESGGEAQYIYSAEHDIKQLYVSSGNLLFLADGAVYELAAGESEAKRLASPENVFSFIPTAYGNLYLTGTALNYTVYAESTRLLSGVSSCYTDGNYMVVQLDNKNYQAELAAAFSGFDGARDMEPFALHGTVQLMSLLSPDDENSVSDYNENTRLEQDFSALLEEAGLSQGTARLMAEDGGTENGEDTQPVSDEPVIPTVSQGQRNIAKRARQLAEIKWTPLEDRYQWGYYGVFKAEKTYTGIPYGQPVNSGGYIGFGTSIAAFADAMLDNTSKFYTSYSTYNKIAPVFSTDCSAFISYAWELSQRKTTYSIPQVAEKVGEQSIYSLQVGDCLDRTTSHVVLASDVTYDAEGKIIGVTIMEQTPVLPKTTRYGEGGTKSLASLQSYYIGGGYAIYRYGGRDKVSYTPNAAVPLDDEAPEGMKSPAPKTQTSSFVGGKTVALSSEGGKTIYYTLDGSVPTRSSEVYSKALTFTATTQLCAIAPDSMYSDSAVLRYTVKVPQSTAPTASVFAGYSNGSVVSSGAKIELKADSGASIYYTLDGSEPDSDSKLYSSPIVLNQSTTIRAVAEKAGQSRSKVMTAAYTVGKMFTISASATAGGSITPSGESSVLETVSKSYKISAQTGYELKDVLVDGVSVGAVTAYDFKNVDADHTIKAVFEINTDTPFTDVPEDAWYREAVAYAYRTKLFNGTSDTSFSPEQTMNRGMFVTVLGRSAGVSVQAGDTVGLVTGVGVNIRKGSSTDTEIVGVVQKKNTAVSVLGQEGEWYKVSFGSATGYIRGDLIKVYDGRFGDVASGNYFSPYVQWAYLAGITSGTSDTAFSPTAEISREQMCTLLGKYVSAYGLKLTESTGGGSFSDDGSISSWAKSSVYALRNAGVISGMGDGGFAPQGTATRAQVAQVFMKFITSAG